MKTDLSWFRDLLLTADPALTKHYADGKTEYTVWIPKRPAPTLESDDGAEETVWTVYIERYALKSNDPVYQAIYDVLEANRIDFDYEFVERERDTKLYHHLFTCRGILAE